MSNQTFSIWDGSVASSFGGGTGTETDPYLINSAAQLAYLEEVFNSSNVKYYDKYYKLTSNIDLDKREWTPIGDLNKMPKIGEYYRLAIRFDGDNHIVRGLSIDRPEENNQGLFGFVSQPSSFKNITIEDAYVSGKQGVGGLVGNLASNWRSGIENCHFSGEIHGYLYVGGISGSGSAVYLRDCTNTGTITTDRFGGGIAGCCHASDYSEVVNCVNTGTITGRSSIGGIVGESSIGTLFKYCHNSGNVSNEQNCAGGITSNSGSFEYCSNSGSITGGTSFIGGIAGGNWPITGISTSKYNQGHLKNCHNSGTITGADYIGGLLGSVNNVTIELCNNTGTVNGTGGRIGGICGNHQGLWNAPIEYCTNEGTVTSSNGGRVGGIVGEGRNVKQCTNTGAVKGYNYVAGICGYCSNADSLIAGCVNDGFIEATSYAGGIASNYYGTIQSCINMAPIQTNSGAGGIVYQSNSAVKNCYNTGSITGSHSLGGIIYSTSGNGFILEKNYNSGEIGSTNQSGAIIGYLAVNGVQIIDCHYHAGSAQKGIGSRSFSVSSDPDGYVDSVVSADDPKTVPAMLAQSILLLVAQLLFWSKKKQQLLTQISKLISISKSLGVGQDENEKPLNEIAGDDMYLVTEHTPVREAADPNSNIIAMSFKKDIIKVLPQTRSVQGDYYRIYTEEGQVGLILTTSLRPANTQGKGNTTYVVKAAQLAVREYPSRSYGGSVGTLSYGDKVQSVPNEKNEEYIEKADNEYWIKVSFNDTITGWVLVRLLRTDTGEAPYEIYKLRLKSDVTDAPDGTTIASLIRGNEVTVVLPEETKPGNTDIWIKIFYDKAFRWIIKDDLEEGPEGSGQIADKYYAKERLKIRDAANGNQIDGNKAFIAGAIVRVHESKEMLKVEGSDEEWLKVYYDSSKIGWVAISLLEELPKPITGHNFKYNWDKSPYMSQDFKDKAAGIANSLNINPDDLMAIMAFESYFNPAQKNMGGGSATGLVQFMPDTAQDLHTTTAALANMTGVEQLDYVYGYFYPYKGKLVSLGDLYMRVLWPAGIGKSDGDVIFAKGDGRYEANIVFDGSIDGIIDGKITKGEATQKVIDERSNYI